MSMMMPIRFANTAVAADSTACSAAAAAFEADLKDFLESWKNVWYGPCQVSVSILDFSREAPDFSQNPKP
jgi:hypothetical protein